MVERTPLATFSNVSVSINLGESADLRITKEGHLVLTKGQFLHEYQSIDLGKAYPHRFDQLIEYLQRLKVHAVI